MPVGKRAPLKVGEWNRLKFTLRGDDVVIAVNEVEVATHKIEAPNQRTFGLFRFADAAGVKVRNVMHRGKWPANLPLLAEQELASAK